MDYYQQNWDHKLDNSTYEGLCMAIPKIIKATITGELPQQALPKDVSTVDMLSHITVAMGKVIIAFVLTMVTQIQINISCSEATIPIRPRIDVFRLKNVTVDIGKKVLKFICEVYRTNFTLEPGERNCKVLNEADEIYGSWTYVGWVFGVLVTLAILTCMWFYHKKKWNPCRNLRMISISIVNKKGERNNSLVLNNYYNLPEYTNNAVTELERLDNNIQKGELKTPTGKFVIAMRPLNESANSKTQSDFYQQMQRNSALKHPNVISLLGVVVEQPLSMLFEFTSQGNLHEFLIANSPSKGKSLTLNQFLDLGSQIGQGMQYLCDNHYVYRDLAARNCWVFSDLVIKIGTFELKRDQYRGDYYDSGVSLLPVRWLPSECIASGKFTCETNVWSFGVTLWEIFSYGKQPHHGYDDQEAIARIHSHKLLPCPDTSPDYCYGLMVECWAGQPKRRPDFAEICQRLQIWKQSETS
ncbi:hypothetical protein Zmor_018415 [Zophobas morio]|uniref:Protein kinase domain-containing protein n=1 Tax=Zophobas morio TaxID=2755281 RepID=A0AA38IE78_9CUCU|nr:hypothetical protein Zmor_018415 [Zophobas morio]